VRQEGPGTRVEGLCWLYPEKSTVKQKQKEKSTVTVEQLPKRIASQYPGWKEYEVHSPRMRALVGQPSQGTGQRQSLEDPDDQMIDEAMRRNNGNKTRAAKELGIERTKFYRRLDQIGWKPGVSE